MNLSGAVGASIGDARGVGTLTNDDGGAVPTPVVWTSAAFVSVSANNLTKTAVAGWNASAVPTRSLPSGNGSVQFVASETTTRRMLGLNRGSQNPAYYELDFAFYLNLAGQLLIYENGVRRGPLTAYATGNSLRIVVEGGVVRYRRNGTLVYTSLVAPSYPLVVDTSLYDPGATLRDAAADGRVAVRGDGSLRRGAGTADRRRAVDLVITVERDGETNYQHLEFQAEPDPGMASRCFRFGVVRRWEVQTETALASGSPGLLALVPLMKGGRPRARRRPSR